MLGHAVLGGGKVVCLGGGGVAALLLIDAPEGKARLGRAALLGRGIKAHGGLHIARSAYAAQISPCGTEGGLIAPLIGGEAVKAERRDRKALACGLLPEGKEAGGGSAHRGRGRLLGCGIFIEQADKQLPKARGARERLQEPKGGGGVTRHAIAAQIGPHDTADGGG